ncbi:MAG: aminotransferase class I/II-fold pyridoxal phosphate-dependent enzyme [Candidatus Sumerlaeaceae bacterium]
MSVEICESGAGLIPRKGTAHKVARHVADVPPSGIRRFFELVIGMDDVISLGVGEPDFRTPWNIREQAVYEIEKGHTTYTSNYGLIELREELAEWLHAKYDVSYDPGSEIVITVGASEAIDIALRAILNPGEEVIVVEPCYVSYAPTVVFAGGVPVLFPTWQKDNFRINLEELQKVVTPRTKAIMLNYPSNPTGSTFNREDLQLLADFVERNDLLVISDEIYAELTYEGQHVSLASFPGMKDHVVIVSGFSKSHAMTGWRLGYLCAPEELAAAMVKIHQYTMLCAPTVSQYAALEALRNSDGAIADMRREYEMRRDFIVSGFNELGLKCLMPEGAFYAFANIQSTGMTSEQFCCDLLQERKVAVVPGNAFGACGEGFIRASYASSFDRLEKAIDKIGRFLRKQATVI